MDKGKIHVGARGGLFKLKGGKKVYLTKREKNSLLTQYTKAKGVGKVARIEDLNPPPGTKCSLDKSLPSEWVICDDGTGQWYHNVDSGKASWVHPGEPFCRDWNTEWKECVSHPSETPFYYHNETGESKWGPE